MLHSSSTFYDFNAGCVCRAGHGPVYQRPPGGNFDGTTTYGSNFPAHPIEARLAAAPPPQRPAVPFDGTSTYSHEFMAKPIEPRPPPAPAPARGPAPPLDASTTYGDTFHQHELPERPHHASPPVRPHVPFDATTTNRDMYVQHAIEPRQAPSAPRMQKAHVPFDGTTTNKVRVCICVPGNCPLQMPQGCQFSHYMLVRVASSSRFPRQSTCITTVRVDQTELHAVQLHLWLTCCIIWPCSSTVSVSPAQACHL